MGNVPAQEKSPAKPMSSLVNQPSSHSQRTEIRPIRKTRQIKEYTAEQFFETCSLINSSFSYDESSILFTSSKPRVFNAFSVPTNGRPPHQLTRSTTAATYAVSYFPHDDRILFVRDAYGNENHHLYVFDQDRKETELDRKSTRL